MSTVAETGAELPAGWTREPLADLGDWCGGGTPSKQREDYWADGTVPWVSPKDMKELRLSGTQDRITEAAASESAAKKFPGNSIAIVVRSGILEHTLPVALVPFEATANQDMRVLTVRPGLRPNWVLWALVASSEEIRRSCQKDGTTVASIDVPRMQQFHLLVPPPEEQDRIVQVIERLTDQIAEGERYFRAGLDGVEGLRAGLLESCWHGFDTEPLEGLLEAPMRNGRSVRTAEDGFPVLRLTALRDGVVDVREAKIGSWTEEDARPFLVEQNDFLVARGNGSLALVGRGALVLSPPPAVAFPDTLIRVRIDESRMRSRFLRLVWNSRRVRAQIENDAHTSAGIYKVNQDMLRSVELPVPPVEEQDRLIQQAESMSASLAQFQTALEQQLARSDLLRRSVLHSLLSGKDSQMADGSENNTVPPS
jgi:type I restriction enzyme S subunit